MKYASSSMPINHVAVPLFASEADTSAKTISTSASAIRVEAGLKLLRAHALSVAIAVRFLSPVSRELIGSRTVGLTDEGASAQ